MKRRTFLALGAAAIIGAAHPCEVLGFSRRRNLPVYGGWIHDPATVQKHQKCYFKTAASHLLREQIRKRVFLWKYLERATGCRLVPHNQGTGDCVAQAFGLGVDILTGIQQVKGAGTWVAKAATEPIYAGSRVEIGGGKYRTAGSHGVWAARYLEEYGVLLRQPYLDGKYDFTEYSAKKAVAWAHICNRCTTWGGGIPDELESIARKHPVRTATLVSTWDEAVAAVANGYPVTLCSSQGFNDNRPRDNQGFLQPGGTWYHAMLLAGIDTISDRPGGLIINSWGSDWVSGPTRFGQPVGSFWADAETIDGMLRMGDSHALSNYKGYPPQHLDYQLF